MLGIDLGTSGVKAVVLGDDGTSLAETAAAYPVTAPRPGWAETDPARWWTATVEAVRAAVDAAAPAVVGAVAIGGQMHGLVLADAAGRPVRPALLWADRRAVAEAAAWEGLPAPVLRSLANPVVPGMTGVLWLWVARHEPASLAEAHCALLPKDWLRLRLTGEVATDPSDASATLLWDVPGDRWADEVLDRLGLDPGLLPPLRPSGEAAGTLGTVEAAELGLTAGIPVGTGAADTAAALLGTGLSDPSEVQLTVGSGAQIVRPLHDPATPERPVTHVYRTADPSGWYAMAAVQNAGLALAWFRALLGASWEELYGAADGREPGAGGVTFVPYLTGERTPVLSGAARGSLVGLDLAADRQAVLQAALEGVAYAIRHAFETLPGRPPERVRLAGGGVRSASFRRLLADVLGVRLEPVEVRSASAVGAALLAARAAGRSLTVQAALAGAPVEPSKRAADYEGPYRAYLEAVASSLSAARAVARPMPPARDAGRRWGGPR